MNNRNSQPDRMFAPATGMMTARRNLISHLVFLARNRSTATAGADPVTNPYGVGHAFLAALHHLGKILDPGIPEIEFGSAEAAERCLVRLQALWTEIVIGGTDPVRSNEACDYAHKLLVRFPRPMARYVNECVAGWPKPEVGLDLLAQASHFINTMEEGVAVGLAQTHVMRVLLARKQGGCETVPAPVGEQMDLVPAAPPSKPVSSPTRGRMIPTKNHVAACERVVEMGELFFDAPTGGTRLSLRLYPLVVGPTGAGKSMLVKTAAGRLGADYYRVTRGDWMPRGSKIGRPTVFLILDRLLASRRLVLAVDEADKMDLDFSKEFSAAVGTDLWNTLDGYFPVVDYLAETKFGNDPVPTVDEIERKVRTALFIVGSGTWQHVFARGAKSAGLGFNAGAVTGQVTMEAIEKHGSISPELLLRFNSDLVFLNYPDAAETGDILRETGITALADELGIRVTPDDVVWTKGGMRVLETLATRLTLEKHRRGKAAKRAAAPNEV